MNITGEKDVTYTKGQLNEAERKAYYKDVIRFLSKIYGYDVEIDPTMGIKELRDFIDYLLEARVR